MIDKSIRADYEMQGKVKNYLGKQKMVKAPKKWKSAPNHPETELAYITKAEKDALIKMNMYGSMNGKANKGPSGIISLNGWGDSGRGTSDASYGGGNVSGGGDNRDYGGGRAAEARSAAAAATQEAARVAAVNAAREEETQKQLKAQSEMQATIAQAEKAEAIKNAQKTMGRINEPFEFPTDTREKAITKMSRKLPRDIYEGKDNEQQREIDNIRAERKIEFNPNLSNKEKSNLKYALGLVADQTSGIDFGDVAKKGIFNLGLKKAGLGMANPILGLLSLFRGKKPSEISKSPVYDLATDLFSNLNKGTRTGTINNRSNVQDTRDGIRSNIISGGGDVVSQKVKEFTGEPTVEKPVEQPSDSQRSQLLKLLQQLQQYNSQNRLNEKGTQTLAQLMSFMNQPITGRSRDI